MVDRIRIAEPSPPYCAACHQAKPEQEHVDFGASYDGPMLSAPPPKALADGRWEYDRNQPVNGVVGVVGHSIDDLVICKDCLAIAAGLIGLGDVAKLTAAARAKDELIDRLQAQVEAAEKLSDATDGARKAREAFTALSRPRVKASA